MTQVPDQKARTSALNISKSFIIQAPAGSGKTSLLTQRYLSLLAKVKNPEEIVAITFTKKAAAEMQERIIEALLLAQKSPPQETYLQKTYQLAHAALIQNEKCHWHLFKNKHRLRILTIDAFCLFLTNKMPLLSKAIPFSFVADDPNEIYRQASMRTLQTAMKDKNLFPSLKIIQEHLGNNQIVLIELFVLMLQKREQWLGHVLSAKRLDRNYFKQVLVQIQQDLGQFFLAQIPNTVLSKIEKVIVYQSSFLNASLPDSDFLMDWENFTTIKATAELFLSSTGLPRKRFTIKEGFPPATFFKNTEEKIAAKEVKETLTDLSLFFEDNEKLVETLQQIKLLPFKVYSTEQWNILSALLNILPLLAAELSVIFSQTSKIDFNEISMQALYALGEDSPTELALYLDYEINHLLIDEFQDTSKKQYKLLERLTESWFDGDGKTLFLVGDPMQSIYRFREANVGLFLYIKQFGINQIYIEPLQLTCNFRSSAGLINEVNTLCNQIFPDTENIENGAVNYNPSETINNDLTQALHGIKVTSKTEEANYIKHYIEQNPNENIAILIRSRSQLKKIVPLLKACNIPIEGVNLEKLSTTYIIKLLLSLVKYIINPQDVLALSTLLNSPLCGINTQELFLLFKSPFNEPLALLTQLEKRVFSLNASSQQRVMKIILIFKHAHHHAYRTNISEKARSVWSQLNGDLIVEKKLEEDVNLFWDLLLKNNKWPLDITLVEKQIDYKYSEQKSRCNVKVMTIHRSKGLEFDTVILPSIDYASIDRNTNILNWLEVKEDFLLSPIHSAFDDKDPMVNYIKSIEKQKDYYERQRLFYVAVTRAKSKLILIDSSKDDKKAVKGSFLFYLENKIPFIQPFKEQSTDTEALKNEVSALKMKRLKQTYFTAPPRLNFIEKSNDIPKSFKKENNQVLGEFIHLQLFYLAEKNNGSLTMSTNIEYVKSQLIIMGLANEQVNMALKSYQKCAEIIKNSSISAWILKKRKSACNEYQLKTKKNTYIIDRTFIDENTRWIIDYKITTDLHKNISDYKTQLNNYALLFSASEKIKIKLMLYYPLLNKKIEWDF